MTSPESNGTKNPYAPEPDYDNGNTLPELPATDAMLESLLARYSIYQYSHDTVAHMQQRDSLFLRTKDDTEEGDPEIYSLHGSDTSMEATLCQFWSGENDNAFISEYVCTLMNIAPSLIRELLELRKTAHTGGQFKIEPSTDYELLNFMDRQLFPNDEPPEYAGANWFVMRNPYDALVGFCAWKVVEHNGAKVGFHYRAGVMPTFRGAGLQKRMIDFRETQMRLAGLSKAVTYTDADNAQSMRSLLKCGYLPYTPTEETCLSGGLARLGRAGFVHWQKIL